MKHRSITGTILYTSKKPERLDERRGIEHFRFTHHIDGKRTLRAHCEIEEPHPSVLRDIVYSLDEHGRLSKEIFQALTGRRGRLTADWFAPRFAELDRDDGQIDQLSARLSGVRTLSYIANRPDWLDQAQGWRDKAKALEERLSDVLHERLTARFVDRRTTALMRALNVTEDAVAEVEAGGAVIVDQECLGELERGWPRWTNDPRSPGPGPGSPRRSGCRPPCEWCSRCPLAGAG